MKRSPYGSFWWTTRWALPTCWPSACAAGALPWRWRSPGLRESDFDAAVCDLKMVDMDGIEVLKVFRKMVPAMPVIMLTGHGSEEAAKDGMQAGAADYLLKPCDIDELLAKLAAAVAKAKAGLA